MDDIFAILDDITINPMVVSQRKSSGYHPSAASSQWTDKLGNIHTVGSCLRKEWYQFSGYKAVEVTTPEAEDKKDAGDYISKRFVEKFKRAGLYVADEVPFYHPDMKVSGRIDILIKDPNKAPKPPVRPAIQDLIGIEVKSSGGYHNIKGSIISTRDTPLMPKPEHIMQAMVYLDYFQQFGLDKWILIYQDRESFRKQWHKICLNERGEAVFTNKENSGVLSHLSIANIKARYAALDNLLALKELPPRDYDKQYSNKRIYNMYTDGLLNKTDSDKIDRVIKKLGTQKIDLEKADPLIEKGDWQCAYCSYKDMCWSENPVKQTTPVITDTSSDVVTEPDHAEDFS